MSIRKKTINISIKSHNKHEWETFKSWFSSTMVTRLNLDNCDTECQSSARAKKVLRFGTPRSHFYPITLSAVSFWFRRSFDNGQHWRSYHPATISPHPIFKASSFSGVQKGQSPFIFDLGQNVRKFGSGFDPDAENIWIDIEGHAMVEIEYANIKPQRWLALCCPI